MNEGGERRLLKLRVPVSKGFWHEYGVPLGLLVATLTVLAVVLAPRPDDGLLVGGALVGLSVGAVLTGLVVYNVVVATLIAVKR